MKSETTLAMELILTKQFFQHEYCLLHQEVTYGKEICDLMGLAQHYRKLVCIELKQSVQDFHSKAKVTFLGNRNYYAMPFDIYEKVKDEIPKEIGVFTLPREYILKKECPMIMIKRCSQQMLHCDMNEIYWSMQNSMKANPYQITNALNLNFKNSHDLALEDKQFYEWLKTNGLDDYYFERDIIRNKIW